ncbi:hypothetical protein QQS45_13085 [Alteriqipengyuania flavescens]|uniref:hypothetical protein n=1 Tax=Alteriqipengyuania flavescens TaxID=3053610 RepID=UPI0025B3CE28|nr:hypothetical protein [Alteriqipengyuania flavescens]WJY18529.1 hypothetical protein QQW98_13080 [Alteriqipengyuania flavescens]WJY24469.1 hypothetical protein QQS45_13085 [Alteriqipengyuania flavescens]
MSFLAVAILVMAPSDVAAEDPNFEYWSEFRDALPMTKAYTEYLGGPYFTTWYIQVEQRSGTKRSVYVETNEKIQWTGLIHFDCDISLGGEQVSITQSSEAGLPTVYDSSLLLSETLIQQWKNGAEIAENEGFSLTLPYEVYVISRYEFCRPEPVEYSE